MDRNKLRDSLMITHHKSPQTLKIKDTVSVRSGRSLQILKPLNAISIVEAARAQTSEEPVLTTTIAT